MNSRPGPPQGRGAPACGCLRGHGPAPLSPCFSSRPISPCSGPGLSFSSPFISQRRQRRHVRPGSVPTYWLVSPGETRTPGQAMRCATPGGTIHMECSTRGAPWSRTTHWSSPESPCPDQVSAGFFCTCWNSAILWTRWELPVLCWACRLFNYLLTHPPPQSFKETQGRVKPSTPSSCSELPGSGPGGVSPARHREAKCKRTLLSVCVSAHPPAVPPSSLCPECLACLTLVPALDPSCFPSPSLDLSGERGLRAASLP